MGRPQLLPNTDVLVRWRDEEHLTQAQITARVNEQNRLTMGSDYQPVSRSAVSVALFKAGETSGNRGRYRDEVPWSPIRPEHHNDYRQMMLRAGARISRGLPVSRQQRKEFESFARRLKDAGAVIHYDPDQGFIAVKARDGVDTGLIRLTDRQIKASKLEAKLAEYLERHSRELASCS